MRNIFFPHYFSGEPCCCLMTISVRSLVYSHACAAVHADRFVYVIYTDYRFFTLVVRMLAPFKVKLVRHFCAKVLIPSSMFVKNTPYLRNIYLKTFQLQK